MSEYVTTIVSYDPQQKSNERGSYVLHKFTDINNTEMVARADVAALVRSYMNQPLRVTVRSEQKGQWLNHYLDHAEPVQNGAPPVYQQQPVQQYQQQPVPPAPTPPPTPPPPVPQQQPTPAQLDMLETQRIHRQVAAKVAAVISTTADEFWQNCVDLAGYFDTGVLPQNRAGFQQADRQYTDDDVPF